MSKIIDGIAKDLKAVPEKLKAQAELLCAACDLTEELFGREER